MRIRFTTPAYLLIAALLAATVLAADTQPAAEHSATATKTVETIVIFRHGEKPASGLGQLTPQGLNRALGISTVLPAKFGKPNYLFAPDPREKVSDRGGLYNYVRPLATIEPLAIRLGMPVQTPCGYRDVAELNDELKNQKYAGATIFVAWEHGYAQRAAVDLVKSLGGNASKVPQWKDDDYDSLYVVKITRESGRAPAVSFELDHEGLDGQSEKMPSAAGK
ncbi:MAG TPA: hypothetical protein VFE47_30075 [Tepidisphaeraceae bacterium]|jgi:hypothetical protein|nr:hypothetical protein [Tepidisphaeraceae bacterium]